MFPPLGPKSPLSTFASIHSCLSVSSGLPIEVSCGKTEIGETEIEKKIEKAKKKVRF